MQLIIKEMNMKITDLQIGDLVSYSYDTQENTVKIDLIKAGEVGFFYHGLHHTVSIDKISPIPLTPEILKKNGWKWDKYWELWIHKNIPYWELALSERFTWVIKTECYTDGQRVAYLPSVHQFQHALRFCGRDELADNFKIN